MLQALRRIVLAAAISAAAAAEHQIFKDRNIQTIADHITIPAMKKTMVSDTVSFAAGKTLLRSSEGRSSFVEAAAGERKILLDAGMQKYYAIKDTTNTAAAQNTLHFLQNIVNYLSK